MGFIHRPTELAELLETSEVFASDIVPGDIIFHQGYVVEVENIETYGYGGDVFLEFAKEVASYDGYERSVFARPNDKVKKIDG